MRRLKYTLISDGTTDANLIPIINWALKEIGGVELAQGVRAEFWRLPNCPISLSDRMRKAIEYFPCDVLFVHRDAEKDDPHVRSKEIQAALTSVDASKIVIPVVTVIPVRMLEAWLLFDEIAIRKAAGNPSGTVKLNLPAFRRVENLPNPKKDLHDALKAASELKGRRLKKFYAPAAFWKVVDYLDDFTPLRKLPGFLAFERSIRCIKQNQWRSGFYGMD